MNCSRNILSKIIILSNFLLIISSCGSGDDPNVVLERQKAVTKAWQQEKTLVEKTGKGTRAWTKEEIKELKDFGKVKGYEGHHINNVANNPTLAGNPDNIKFVKRGEGHIAAHGGAFSNPTKGKLINRRAKAENSAQTNNSGFLKLLGDFGTWLIGIIYAFLPSKVAAFLVTALVAIGGPILGIFGIHTSEPGAAGCGCLALIGGVGVLIAIFNMIF